MRSAFIALVFPSLILGACASSPEPRPEPEPAPAATASPAEASPAECAASSEVAVQVLGSGGPIADDARASSGYVVWAAGRARLLVDLGGGAFLRLAQSGVDASDPQALLLTHHHVDHTADVPAFLKSASFGQRGRPLPVVGPTGNDRFPAIRSFLSALVGVDEGAFRYLGGYLTEEGNPFALVPREVDVEERRPATVLEREGLRVRAVGVPHGVVPALGYAVEVDGVRIGFTGDQRMDEPRFRALVKGVEILVAHHAIPEDAGEAARALHATPSQIGKLAASAGGGRLVLSHHMQRSLRDLESSRRHIRRHYEGPIAFADDLDCFTASETGGGG